MIFHPIPLIALIPGLFPRRLVERLNFVDRRRVCNKYPFIHIVHPIYLIHFIPGLVPQEAGGAVEFSGPRTGVNPFIHIVHPIYLIHFIPCIVPRRLVERLNFVDRGRVCIWGWSFGGYLAAMALAEDGRTIRQAFVDKQCTTLAKMYTNVLTVQHYFIEFIVF